LSNTSRTAWWNSSSPGLRRTTAAKIDSSRLRAEVVRTVSVIAVTPTRVSPRPAHASRRRHCDDLQHTVVGRNRADWGEPRRERGACSRSAGEALSGHGDPDARQGGGEGDDNDDGVPDVVSPPTGSAAAADTGTAGVSGP